MVLQTIKQYSIEPNRIIPDKNSKGITSEINFEDDLSIDYVQVEFFSEHPYWGDLEITLTSPDGTKSVLSESSLRKGDDYQYGWSFGIARFLGESALGIWTLSVKDNLLLDEGHLQKWSLKVYGSRPSGSTVPLIEEPGQFLQKCIAKYPQYVGFRVGESYSCGDDLICQTTTGGTQTQITTVAVYQRHENEVLSYFIGNQWHSITYSELEYCE